MLSDQELRLIALETAVHVKGPKATTAEVLDAEQQILDFLRGVYGENAGKPN